MHKRLNKILIILAILEISIYCLHLLSHKPGTKCEIPFQAAQPHLQMKKQDKKTNKTCVILQLWGSKNMLEQWIDNFQCLTINLVQAPDTLSTKKQSFNTHAEKNTPLTDQGDLVLINSTEHIFFHYSQLCFKNQTSKSPMNNTHEHNCR